MLQGPLRQSSKDTQPRNAAIGINVKARVRDFTRVQQLFFVRVPGIRLQLRPRQYFLPGKGAERAWIDEVARRGAYFERTAFRKIAFEMGSIDFDAADVSRRAQTHDTPIMSGPAAAARFPAVMHPGRAARENQIVARAEKHVARNNHPAAVLDGGEVHFASRAIERRPVWDDFAVDTKTRHTAVRINFETQVRGPVRWLERKWISSVAGKRRLRQQDAPLRCVVFKLSETG